MRHALRWHRKQDISSFKFKWHTYEKLINFPFLNLSKVKKFNHAWYNCKSLIDFPLLDTSNGTSFISAWQNCGSLVEFPKLDLSNGMHFNYAWRNCHNLVKFPKLNVSNGVDFSDSWTNCKSLVEFPQLNITKSISFHSAWYKCTKLEHFPPNMFDNLSTNITTNCFLDTWAGCKLSIESVENILSSINKIDMRLISYLNRRPITLDMGIIYIPLPNNILDLVGSLKSKGWVVFINEKKI